VSRFIGVIVSPRATFESVVAHPKWLGMLVLTTLIVTVCTTLPMTTEAGREAVLDTQVRQMESFGVQVTDQMYEQMRGRIGYAPYTTAAGVIVVSPIIVSLMAGILFGIFNAAMGGTATFKQVFAVVVHAGAISALGQLFTGPLNYVRGTMASATNLAVLLPMLTEKSFVARLAGMIDLFVIWWLFVLAVGIAVLYRRRTQPIALSLFAVYGVIALCAAAVMSRLGGSN
jgi:maltodextrin utilization protein YvdJ